MSDSFQDIGLIIATIRVGKVSYKTKVNPRWLGQPPPYTESAKIDVDPIGRTRKIDKVQTDNFFKYLWNCYTYRLDFFCDYSSLYVL